MIPFYEPNIKPKNKQQLSRYKEIAQRLGLQGLIINGMNFSKKSSSEEKEFPCISRLDINEDNVEKVKQQLSKTRKQCELLSITTTNPKVAQWVAKDNRVDIISIPLEKMKEIINEQLANVAAQNKTFFEIDLSPLLGKGNMKSYYIRMISKTMNIILKKRALFIFTTNPTNPIDLRDKRALIAIASIMGISDKWIKNSSKEFANRITENQKKLSEGFITPGLTEKIDKIDLKDSSPSYEEIQVNLPENLNELDINQMHLERQRYLLFEIISDEQLMVAKKELEEIIWDYYSSLYGIVGSSRAGIYFNYFNEKENIGIMRCSHLTLNSTKSVLALITTINQIPAQLHIMKVSGTIQNLSKTATKKEKSS